MFDSRSGRVMNTGMGKTIQIKSIRPLLRQRLDASAEGNRRILSREALARLERSFEIEDALATRTHQKWIDEAMAGEFRKGSVERLRAICRKARGEKE